MRSFVILNVVKNLSERIDVGAIVDGYAIPEILRFAQDDIGVGFYGFSWVLVSSCGFFWILVGSSASLPIRTYQNLLEPITPSPPPTLHPFQNPPIIPYFGRCSFSGPSERA